MAAKRKQTKPIPALSIDPQPTQPPPEPTPLRLLARIVDGLFAALSPPSPALPPPAPVAFSPAIAASEDSTAAASSTGSSPKQPAAKPSPGKSKSSTTAHAPAAPSVRKGEKKAIVLRALAAPGGRDRGDAEIASELGYSRSYVSSVRKSLESGDAGDGPAADPEPP